MQDIEQRLDYLESNNNLLQIQNKVLQATIKAMIRALPADLVDDIVESIQIAFEDIQAELNYENSPDIDLFHQVADEFFREKKY